MPIGPVEYLLVEFPGSHFNGDIVPALAELVDKRLISIIDLVFVRKHHDGTVAFFDLDEFEQDIRAAFADVDGDYGSLLSDDDLAAAAEALEPGSSAGLLVFENVWAGPFMQAIRGAGGQVVANERISMTLVDAALADLEPSEGAGL